MLLSEAVKAAGIGGRVRRECWAKRTDDVVAGYSALYWDRDGQAEFEPSFEDATFPDWSVVQRAPREWTMWIGNGEPHGEQLGCMEGHCKPIRLREVVGE